MEMTFSAFCPKFIIILAILTTAKTTLLCPNGCSCTGGYPAVSMNVDCQGRPDVDREQLSQQLDSLLSSNLTYGHLTSLRVTNTPLTHVPRSVCRLTTLTQLSLDRNRLTRLPDNCLSNLTALTSFTASENYITQLQDGLFDGLHKLVTLKLDFNRISSIGLQVFNGSAMLTGLRLVDLTHNIIQALEPWPYYLGLNDGMTRIELRWNNISAFTNMMNWKASCGGMGRVRMYLSLGDNPIKHISDLVHGWNVNITTWMCLSPTTRDDTHSIHSYIYFNYVYLECDCVDFDIFRMFFPTLFQSNFLEQVYCGSPENLFHRTIRSVPLEELVCEVTERCPPGCRCVHRPANATLHLYCSNANFTALPLELPQLPKSYTKYKLDFSNNRLRRLERRDYFVNTSILDVSNCNIHSIDLEMWNDLANIMNVFLDGNQLQSLPSSIATVSLKIAHFSLRRNPWKCSCDASWMSSWLKSVNSSINNTNEVTCSFPSRLQNKQIMNISSEAFCVDPTSVAVKRALTVSMSSVVGAAVFLISIGVIVYRLRVKLYTRWKFHPFDRDECLREDMIYDVFLSCSSDNNLPHGNGIREQLEERGYRVCYPPRDFLAGETVYDNIYNAIVRSKRTVCFVTPQFLQRFVYIIFLHVYEFQ